MPRPERGQTPAGFRAQLLARLRNAAEREAVPVQRLQQRVAFERLLACLPTDGSLALKGGFALELRYGWTHRPTRDIDLRIDSTPEAALRTLRIALTSAAMTAEPFSFEIVRTSDLQGAPGGGMRVQVQARLAGIAFAAFHLDLSAGDALAAPLDTLEGSDLLDFAGVPRLRFLVYPVVQQLAEKLHAYTLPRGEENTRVKDLFDLVVIAQREVMDADRLRHCLLATFERRATHQLPSGLPAPPAFWSVAYRRLAAEVAVTPRTDLAAGYALAAQFWNPLLAGLAVNRRWLPAERRWSAEV